MIITRDPVMYQKSVNKVITQNNFPCHSGWIVVDRCGRHFELVLNFLRDGSVPLPEDRRELDEVLKEAQYYRVQGLIQHCLNAMQVHWEYLTNSVLNSKKLFCSHLTCRITFTLTNTKSCSHLHFLRRYIRIFPLKGFFSWSLWTRLTTLFWSVADMSYI